MRFKICAIGCGGMATAGHGPSFARYAQLHPESELTACCDIDAARAEQFKNRFGFARAYTDMNEMLRKEKPDAVSLVVPVPLTKQLSIQLLEAGIPVILEKPPGMNREETLRMMDAAERTGTPNMVAFNRRTMPTVERFLELRKGLSPLLWQYDFFRMGRKDPDFSTTTIHAIDALRFLAGQDYRRVDFTYQPNPQNAAYVPNILLNCEFEDGQRGLITFAPATGISVERCTMHTTNEMITAALPYHGSQGSIDGLGSILMAKDHEVVLHELAPETEAFISNGFYRENEIFFDCIQAGTRPWGDIATGLQAVEIAECIRNRKSMYEKA